MKGRVTFALILSLVLVGGATVFRLSPDTYKSSNKIVYVETPIDNEEQEEINKLFFESINSPTQKSLKEPSSTELIGRGLITGYIDLATKGVATQKNLEALANQYVESVPSFRTLTPLTLSDIQTTPNTPGAFKTYEDEVNKIHEEYAKNTKKIAEKAYEVTKIDSNFRTFANTLGNAYTKAANKLKNLKAPASVADAHLELINSYLSSAESLKILAGGDNDSASLFAAMVTVRSDVEMQNQILGRISQIIRTNG